jgi:hypothetical protein
MNHSHYTPGVLALRLGVQPHHLARLIKRRLIPFTRAGRFHLIAESDVPRVCEALKAAGIAVIELPNREGDHEASHDD